MTASPPCIRCGDFVTPEKTALAGLALCRVCIDAGLEPTERFSYPKVIVWARFRYMAAMLALMAVAFAVPVATLSGPYRLPAGVGLMVCVEVVFFVLFFSAIQHAGLDRWKRDVRAKVLLPDALEAPFVMYVPRRPRFWNLTIPFDAALLVEAPDGFVLLGEKTRLVLHLEDMTAVTTQRIIMNPPRTAVRVEISGEPRYFAFIEKGTFRANRALAVACAARATERLTALRAASRPGPATP